MNRSYLLRLLAIVFLTGGYVATAVAQTAATAATLRGTALADDGEAPLDYASVSLSTVADSAVVDFQLTDEAGRFSFTDIPAGDYYLTVSRIGFTDFQQSVPGLTAGEVRQQTIRVAGGGTDLAVVEVTGYRPTVQFSGNKMIVAVANLPNAANSDGLEILSKVPGVRVEQEAISLNGFGNVNVLINGRKRTMTAGQAASLLRSIPASSILSIEVVSGKSVNQDASGTGGEINIITNQSLGQFFNLSVRNRLILDDRLSNSHSAYLNLNGRRLRFNGGLCYRRNHSYGTSERRERYTNLAGDQLLATNRLDAAASSLSHEPSVNAGLEYDLSTRQRIGASASAYFTERRGNNSQLSQFLLTDGEARPSSLGETGTVSDNLTTVDVYYERDLDTLGSTLKSNFGYLTGYIRESSDFDLRQPPGIGDEEALRLRNSFPLGGAQYSFRTDLEKHFNPETMISAGFKLSDGQIDNYAVYDTISFMPPRRNFQFSDSLGYRERVGAVYLSGQRNFGPLTVQAGGRYERTSVTTRNYVSGQTGGQDYGNFFPNASLSYDGGQNYQFSLSYSASIVRPNYRQLNPYTKYLDNFTLSRGNNELLPQTARRLTLSAQLFQFAYLNFGYVRGKDYVWDVRELQDDGVTTLISPQNAYDITAGFVQAIINYRLGPGGKVSGQLSGLLVPFDIQPNESFPNQEQFAGTDSRVSYSGSLRYKFSDRLSVVGDFDYTRSFLRFQTRYAARWDANLGATYKIPGDAFTVSVYASDLFNTNNLAGERFFPGQTSTFASDYNTRRLSISLNYRLGRLKGNYQRGPEGEVNRFQ